MWQVEGCTLYDALAIRRHIEVNVSLAGDDDGIMVRLTPVWALFRWTKSIPWRCQWVHMGRY